MTGDKIYSTVLKKIVPDEDEKKALLKLTEYIISRIDEVAKELGVDAHGLLVGSIAKGTWISGDLDIDIFIMLPETISEEKMESLGLQIAKKVAAKYEERYAEHPYIKASFKGYAVDLVPCFSVSNPASIKSAVDRTPFHNEYINARIGGLEDEVRLLKQFMKGIGVYGAELKTMGFSGYLCELLVLKYGSFLNVLQSTKRWRRGVIIDIKDHKDDEHDATVVVIDPVDSSRKSFRICSAWGGAPLVVIDPVDSSRNVAAAVSLDKFCVFIDATRTFLKASDVGFFFPSEVKPMTDNELADELKRRGMNVFAVVFKAPDVVDDVLYPQLYKALKSIEELLYKNDFRVFHGDVWSNSISVILLEMEIARLPPLKIHRGPPVESVTHAEKFKAKHADRYPYIRYGKYAVEMPRKYADVNALLKSELRTCGLGKHVSGAIDNGYRVLKNAQIIKIDDEAFRVFLRKYFRV